MLSSRNLLMLTGLGAVLAIIVVFAGVATRAGSDGALPSAGAAPTTGSSTAPTDTDDRGFMGAAARCDEGQTAVAFGRTQRSTVVICAKPEGGGYQYRGVRANDGATLTAPAEATGDGSFVARNDGATYTVSPSDLVVTAGGKVIYRDTWVAYQAPSFAAEHGATASATPTATQPR